MTHLLRKKKCVLGLVALAGSGLLYYNADRSGIMAYSWYMCILQRLRTRLLLFLTRIGNNKKMIGPSPHDIPHLPSDVIINILSWLPAECVLKFRRVCKKWLVLTSSPYFVEMHCKRAVPVLVLQMASQYAISKQAACCHDLYIFDDQATDFKPDFKLQVPRIGSLNVLGKEADAFLLGSCNGFLVFEIKYLTYLVLNLVTQEHAILELPQGKKRSLQWTWCGIVFHFGIGEYMLIFWQKMECGKFSFAIYLLSSKLWRLTSTSSDQPKDKVDPIAFNDRLHWMSASSSCGGSIISCDMNVEGFCSMSHPDRDMEQCDLIHKRMCLLEHEGKLAFGDYRHPRIDIWVLEDYNTWSWSLKYNVNLLSDVKCVSQQDIAEGPIAWAVYWRIINCELIFYWRGVGIVGYHLERKTTRMFDAPSYQLRWEREPRSSNVVSYKKCLVPLHSKRVVS